MANISSSFCPVPNEKTENPQEEDDKLHPVHSLSPFERGYQLSHSVATKSFPELERNLPIVLFDMILESVSHPIVVFRHAQVELYFIKSINDMQPIL